MSHKRLPILFMLHLPLASQKVWNDMSTKESVTGMFWGYTWKGVLLRKLSQTKYIPRLGHWVSLSVVANVVKLTHALPCSELHLM